MSRLSITLPPLAPDYSGAASAFFDLGGIVVMHDASGCTGNYTGYDEPRWLNSRSAVYCSGLRRMDAVLGNDDKFIQMALNAAESLDPTLIAFLGGPVPMIIGTDREGRAAAAEAAGGTPSFGINSTGERYYHKGASEVFIKLIKRFAKPFEGERSKGVKKINVLGMIPLDVGGEMNYHAVTKFITDSGYELVADFAMGLSIAQIERCPSADMNIVVSLSGLDTAEYMQQKYGIPFVCVMPLGSGQNLKDNINGTEKLTAVHDGKKVLIIHEQVFSNSLRECAEEIGSSQITVGSMLDLDSRLYQKVNKAMVNIERVTDKYDVQELKGMIQEHVAYTNSEVGKKILDNFKEYLPKFKKIIPEDYEKMMSTIIQMEEKGLSREKAKIEAFNLIKNGR